MINTFKKKSMYAALLAGMGAIGAAGTAQATYLSPDGTGQVLIYPYYTAQTPTASTSYVTAFSVVNTGVSAKAVKVRFREGKNSREVLDFNLYLSPKDVWTGAVVATTDGAKLITTDKSCTVPAIPAAGVDFRNAAYTGATGVSTGNDGAGAGLDRTREGYFEMIQLGSLSNTTQAGWVTHGAGGAAPANCAAIIAANNTVSLAAGGNELFGGGSIIGVASGVDYTYDASAFADFLVPPVTTLTTILGNESPNFTNGSAISTVYRAGGSGSADAVTSNWTNGVDAISATIMHNNLMNEYVLDSTTLSGTDWVVNFPTKRYYVQTKNTDISGITLLAGASGGPVNGVTALPFQRTFWNGACDDVTPTFWDREEFQNTSTVDFSPATTPTASLCWEANVVTFNNSKVLGSAVSSNVNVGTRQNGWMNLGFRAAAQLVSVGGLGETPTTVPHTYNGLPTIGFAVQSFVNQNAAPGVLATYGGNFYNKTSTLITP